MPLEGSLRTALARPRPFLGPPRVLAPRKEGHVSATVQFIVPGLVASAEDRQRALALFEHLEVPVHAAAIERASNEGTGQPGIFVSATFYVPDGPPEGADQAIDTASALLVERFLGLLSFLAGVRCVAINAQTSRTGEGSTFSTTLEPSSRSGQAPARLHWPDVPFAQATPSSHVFNALLWLRRGLAARDPLLTYVALMNGLLSAARDVVGTKPEPGRCSRCGGPQAQEASETDWMRELVVGQLGAAPELFERVWQARRAALGEDDRAVTAEVLRRLTELKYDAATLCYRAIKRALGMPLDAPPQLDPALFVTSTLMDVH
jgi:hypothetical protein